jgi:hypothetical protein
MNFVKAVHLNINETGTHHSEFGFPCMHVYRFNETIVCNNYSARSVEDVSIEKFITSDLV